MRSPPVTWWPGSVVSDSGVHLHHLVFGIVMMMVGGTLGFWFYDAGWPLYVCALLFGIGAGLTLDEFALFVHLDDVYWGPGGPQLDRRRVIAVGAMMLVLFGIQPVDFTSF